MGYETERQILALSGISFRDTWWPVTWSPHTGVPLLAVARARPAEAWAVACLSVQGPDRAGVGPGVVTGAPCPPAPSLQLLTSWESLRGSEPQLGRDRGPATGPQASLLHPPPFPGGWAPTVPQRPFPEQNFLTGQALSQEVRPSFLRCALCLRKDGNRKLWTSQSAGWGGAWERMHASSPRGGRHLGGLGGSGWTPTKSGKRGGWRKDNELVVHSFCLQPTASFGALCERRIRPRELSPN